MPCDDNLFDGMLQPNNRAVCAFEQKLTAASPGR